MAANGFDGYVHVGASSETLEEFNAVCAILDVTQADGFRIIVDTALENFKPGAEIRAINVQLRHLESRREKLEAIV